MLKKFRDWAVGTIYLMQVQLGAINTILLVLLTITGNLEHIERYIPWSPWAIVLVFWILGMVGLVLFSLFMDKAVGYTRIYTSFANSRNPEINKLLETTESIDKRLQRIEERLK